MPPGLPEFALIIGGLLVVMFVGLVIAMVFDQARPCPGQVVESVEDGSLHDAEQWELQLLPGYTGPWPCPFIEPPDCPIHREDTP